MAKKDGPLAAAQAHLGTGGDDKPGRRVFMLEADQIEALDDARKAPKEQREAEETAFWRAAGDRLGFNPITVETDDDTSTTGQFTAWPAGVEVDDEEVVDLSEGAHTLAIERMEALAREAVLTNKSLVADVRDFIVEQIKARPKPWSATSPAEQRDVFSAAEFAAEELVRKIVEGLATLPGTDPIRALLVSYADKGEITATIKVKAIIPADVEAAVLGLHKCVNKMVLITPANKDDYNSPRDPDVDEEEPLLFGADGEQ